MHESPFSKGDITGVGENGKPVQWNIRRFQNNLDLFRKDTIPAALERLKPQLDRIERFFVDGNVKALLEVMAQSAPAAYESFELSLADAQLINDWSGVALACLIGEDAVRPLRFRYISAYGQDSGDVAKERYMAFMGLRGKEAQDSAVAEFDRKNPDADKVLREQQEAIRAVLSRLGGEDKKTGQ